MANDLAAKTAKLLEEVDDALEQLNATRQKLWALVTEEPEEEKQDVDGK